LFVASSIVQADTDMSILPIAALSKAYKQAIISPLNKASSEIKDLEIAKFFQKIITSYELNKAPENSSNEEPASLAILVPDLRKIIQAALNSQLVEAGKQIKDKELSTFYNDFMGRINADKSE
jgi:hypothetical protein